MGSNSERRTLIETLITLTLSLSLTLAFAFALALSLTLTFILTQVPQTGSSALALTLALNLTFILTQVPQSGSSEGTEVAKLVTDVCARSYFKDGNNALHYFRHHARLLVQVK